MAQTFIDEKTHSKDELEALEVAEAAREQTWEHPSFAADLFMGHVAWKSILPYPVQPPADKAEGDAFIAKLEALMESVDADKIDRDEQIPDTIMKKLINVGAFAIKIPKEYGGLGLSQVNYLRALAVVSKYDGSIAATLSAHQSIGVPQPLLLCGTKEQKQKYLPKIAKGAVSAFALTEPDVGSDPARVATTATPSEDGKFYTLNGMKLWCTNGAIADIFVVMAQTPPVTVRGKQRKQITAFIVERSTPGLEVVHRCRFMGLNGIQNALIRFKDVKVPKENILWETGRGLKLALMTLNAGRLSIPACCVGGSRVAIKAARQWALERVQWGAPVGKHEPGAAKLASMASGLYTLEALTYIGGAWVDHKSQDIRLEAAMAKLYSSLVTQDLLDKTLQLRGGRGYERASSLEARGEKPVPVERWYRDARINQIVEGTNEIMRLFISREALDKHLTIAGNVLNRRASMLTRLGSLVAAAGFYSWWYPTRWIKSFVTPLHLDAGKFAKHMRYIDRTSARLARTMFHLILRYGPKLEKKQAQLGRLVDISMELLAMSVAISAALSDKRPNADKAAILYCKEGRLRIDNHFRTICHNNDVEAYKFGMAVLESKFSWIEDVR